MKKIMIIIATLVVLILAAAGIFIINFNINEEIITISPPALSPSNVSKPINGDATIIWQKPLPEEIQVLPTNAVISTMTFEDSNDKGNMIFKESHVEEQQKLWKEKTNDQEFKKMIEQRQYQLLSSKYQSLITYLEMSDKQKNTFLKTIIDKNISLRDLGIRIYGNIPHGITEDNKEQLVALREEYLSNMQKLLGEESYDLYVQYENTEPEREQVEIAKSQLKDAGLALTQEQEDTLITAMYNARLETDVYLFTNVGDWPDPNYLSDENNPKQLEGMDKLTENYIQQAEKTLTPEQYTQFKKIINQQNEHQKKAINFISRRP